MWPMSFIMHANDKEHSINSFIELCLDTLTYTHRPISQSQLYTLKPKFTCQFLNVSERRKKKLEIPPLHSDCTRATRSLKQKKILFESTRNSFTTYFFFARISFEKKQLVLM